MQNQKYTLKLVLIKKGDMRYFSQLDLCHILERALRRSNLPLYYTQGFNPHNKISFTSGLKLGVSGKINLSFHFSEKISFLTLTKSLSPQLPKGLKLAT